jgi:hypothetical protein
MKGFIFWDITLYSPLKVNRRFGGLPSAFMVISCSAYSSILKTDATCSSETTAVRISNPTSHYDVITYKHGY